MYQREGETRSLFLPKVTESSGLPIASELMHKAPLQVVIVQKQPNFSFTGWLGVLQHKLNIVFYLSYR